MAMELVTKLPYDHPYRWDGTLFGGKKLWRPFELGSALALWLDSEDTTTVTLNSGNVAQWDDKSGNGNNASEPVASKQPAYGTMQASGKPALVFDGIDDRMLFTNIECYQKAVFVVYELNNLPAAAAQILGGNGYNNQLRQNNGAFVSYASATPAYSSFPISPTTLVDDELALVSALFGDDLSLGVNAEYNTSGTYIPGTTGLLYGQIAARGAIATGTDFLEGRFGEIIITDYPLLAIRQTIEGYLAWKWGIAAKLPSGHRFRNRPPTV